MKKNSLTYTTLKNSSYNIIGYLWPIIFTLVITPIIVLTVGVKEYGIYLFINTSIGLLGIFELGLYLAVIKDMSYYYGKKDNESIVRLVHTANLLFLILGIFYFTVSTCIAFLSVDLLPASFLEYQKYSIFFLFAGGILFFNTITATYTSTLQAVQRFDISTKISIASVTLTNILVLFVVKMGWSIFGIFTIQLILAFIFSIVVYYQAKKVLPIATFHFHLHIKEVINCYRFGVVAFLNNMAGTSLSSLDKIIIPLFTGPSNLTYYSMPGNVAMRIPGISGAISGGMLSLTSQLSGGDEMVRIQNLYIRTFRLITVIAGALTVTTIAFSYEVLKFWLNTDFAEKSSNVLIILALTNFILALLGPLSSFLLGFGKLKFLSISSVCMAVLNIVSLFILLPYFGIVGAAFAYLISVLPVVYLFYFVEKNYLNLLGRKKYYIKLVTGNLFVASIVLLFDMFIANHIINLVTLLIAGGTSFLVYIILYKLFNFFEKEDWHDIEKFCYLFFKKFRIEITTTEPK